MKAYCDFKSFAESAVTEGFSVKGELAAVVQFLLCVRLSSKSDLLNCGRRFKIASSKPFTGFARYRLCSAFKISAARSPMITQGAIVLPVVTRGMMEPSAIRRFVIP